MVEAGSFKLGGICSRPAMAVRGRNANDRAPPSMMKSTTAACGTNANSKPTTCPKNKPPFEPVDLTFPTFRKLPPEIRILIWEYAQPTFLHMVYPHVDAATATKNQQSNGQIGNTLFWKLMKENTRSLIVTPRSKNLASHEFYPHDPRLLTCFESHQVVMRQRQRQSKFSGEEDSFSWQLELRGKFAPTLPDQLANTQHFGNWHHDLLYLAGNYSWQVHSSPPIPSSASILYSMGTTFKRNPGIRRIAVRTTEKALGSLDIGKGGTRVRTTMLDTDGRTRLSAKDRLAVAFQEWEEPALLMLVVDLPLCGYPEAMRWQYRFELVWGMRERLKLDGGGSGFVGYEQAWEYCRWFYQTKWPGRKKKSVKEKNKVDRIRAVLKEVLAFLGKEDVVVKVVVDVNRGFGGGRE